MASYSEEDDSTFGYAPWTNPDDSVVGGSSPGNNGEIYTKGIAPEDERGRTVEELVPQNREFGSELDS